MLIVPPVIACCSNQSSLWCGFVKGVVYNSLTFLVVMSAFFKESLPHEKRIKTPPHKLYQNYFAILANRKFNGFMVANCCAYAGFFSFLAVSPMILMNHFHLSVIAYGSIVALNAIGVLIATLCSIRLNRHFSFAQLSIIALLVMIVAAVALIILNLVDPQQLVASIILMMIIASGFGLLRPAANAGALKLISHQLAGSAAAVFNSALFGFSTLATLIASLYLAKTFEALGMFILVIEAIAVLISTYCFRSPER